MSCWPKATGKGNSLWSSSGFVSNGRCHLHSDSQQQTVHLNLPRGEAATVSIFTCDLVLMSKTAKQVVRLEFIAHLGRPDGVPVECRKQAWRLQRLHHHLHYQQQCHRKDQGGGEP